jgi:hypothetical protein
MTTVFLNNARTKCCYTSKHRNPLRAPRKELDCSHYKVAYHPYTGEYVGVDTCPKKPFNTIYKDNYAVSCTSCDPSVNAVCYNPVIRTIQNRNGYINDKYNYSSAHYLQRRNRKFSQLVFNFLSNVPIEGTNCANFNTAQHNSISLMRDNSDCKVDCFPDCSNCETVACRGYSKCAVKNTNCCAVYKRSNAPFRRQGAVSGGSRINRLKYQTVLKSQSTYKVPNPSNTSDNNKKNAYGSINSSGNINAVNGAMPVMLYRSTGPTYKRNLGGFCGNTVKPPTLITYGRCRTRGKLCSFK